MLHFRTDTAAITVMTALHAQMGEIHAQKKREQNAARIRVECDRFERACQRVIVEKPEPTGNALQDWHNELIADNKAKDQEQRNAATRYHYRQRYGENAT